MSINRIIFNCKDKTFSLLAGYFYDKKGKVLHSYDIGEFPIKWQSAVPDSVVEGLLEVVCLPKEVIAKAYILIMEYGCNDVNSCRSLFQTAIIEYLEESRRYYTPSFPDDPKLLKPPPPAPAPAPAP